MPLDPAIIHRLILDPEGLSALLELHDDEGWAEVDAHLSALQDTVNGYLAYVIDGGLLRDHGVKPYPCAPDRPALEPANMKLTFVYAPPPSAAAAIDEMRRQCSAFGVTLWTPDR